jgi:hypothetical protein
MRLARLGERIIKNMNLNKEMRVGQMCEHTPLIPALEGELTKKTIITMKSNLCLRLP